MTYPDSIRFPHGLYGITPEFNSRVKLLEAVEAAAAGGMTALQWRQKQLPAAEQLPRATEMAALCKRLGVVFLVNDSIDLAIASGACGVHLGKDDDSLAQARQRLGPGKIIGSSCYNRLDLAQQALAADADYVAFGSVYPSSTKPQAVRAPLALLGESRQLPQFAAHPRPAVVVIGGITANNALPLLQAGADSVAVITDLFNASDIRAQAQRYANLFSSI